MPTVRSYCMKVAVVAMALATLFLIPNAWANSTGKSTIPPQPPPPSPPPFSIDRSVMRTQIAGAAAIFKLKRDINNGNPRLLLIERDLADILDVPSGSNRTGVADSLYIGASAYVGQGRPIAAAPDLLFESTRYRLAATYANVFDKLNGQDIGIRYTLLPTSWNTFYADTYGLKSEVDVVLHNRAPGSPSLLDDLVKLDRALANYQKKRSPTLTTFLNPSQDVTMTLQNVRQALVSVTDVNGYVDVTDRQNNNVLKKYILVSEALGVSLNGDYLSFNGGGHYSKAGVSASKLLPLHKGGVPPALTPLVTIENVQFDDHRYPSASGTQFEGALIFQDRAPALTSDQSNLAPAWNYKFGLQYATPALGAHETYGEFVRYRDPRTYAEITVSAGKDGARNDFLGVSIGKTFYY